MAEGKRRGRRRGGRIQGGPPRAKHGETPRRGQRPRPGILGYWMRRPEPSVGLSVIFASVALGRAALTGNWALLLIVGPCAAAAVWVWMTRRVWRWNADRWRRGYRDVF